MGFLDRLLSAPATRRLTEADAAAEKWATAPAPVKPGTAITVRAKASGSGPPRIPRIDWTQDQSPPQPGSFSFRSGYSDYTFQNFSAPLGFEGFGLDRIRSAVALHRLGNFFESSAMAVTVLAFAPVLAALQQRVAPILGLARRVEGGDKGLAKLVATEVLEQLTPAGGLMSSPHLPPALWGTMAASLALMNFAVLQHVDGDPDPDTGVRPRFTRTWPTWALQATRSPRKLLAITDAGPVEVCNDGKFTLVADEEEPWLSSPILALGEETFGGKLSAENRYSFLDFFGKPKLWATPPQALATHGTDGGDAFTISVLDHLYGPDGRAVLPFGSKVEAVSISGEGAKAFQDAQLDAIIRIFMVLTGSAGTVGSGSATGAGPYQAAKGGAWAVRSDLYTRDTLKIVRALNQGHVLPYCQQNYEEGIARARKVGAWRYPVLSIPIPAPDEDERIAAEVTRQKAYTDQIVADRAAGGLVDQERADRLAERFKALPMTLVDPKPKGAELYAWHIENGLVAPDEARDRLGLPPLPNDAGSLDTLAADRLAVSQAEAAKAAPPPATPAPSEPAEMPPAQAADPAAAEAQAAFVRLADRYAGARLAAGATAADLERENLALAALVAKGAP